MAVSANISSRVLGLAAGALLGDALGAPFNGVKGGHVRQLAGGPVESFLENSVLFPEKPDRNWLPGLHTSRGQEFLAVLAGPAAGETGQHPLARAAANLRELAGDSEPAAGAVNMGAIRQPGRPMRRSLDRWRVEYPWELVDHFAAAETQEGAGPALRVLAAAAHQFDPIECARLTHTRELSLMAAWIVARAAAMLMSSANPKKVDGSHFIECLVAEARATEDELRGGALGTLWRELQWGYPRVRLSAAIAPVASLLEAGDDALAERTIVSTAADSNPEGAVTHVQHGFAAAMVPWVLYRALGPLSPINAVEDSINRGGETSLAAGLIGGLAGARWGIEHWPEELLDETWAMEDALSFAAGPSTSGEEVWLNQERVWTEQQEEMREVLRKRLSRVNEDAPAKPKKPKPTQQDKEQGSLPFAPPPQVWLGTDLESELAPWEKKRLKAERGRRRIGWKQERREKSKLEGEGE